MIKPNTSTAVLDCLKHDKYSHLPLPKGDGETDDTDAIQARINAGLNAFTGSIGSTFRITKTLQTRWMNGSGGTIIWSEK
jgi:hypothetical protein